MRAKRAQMSVEFIAILATILILAGIVTTIWLNNGQDVFTTQQQANDAYWSNAQIGILEHSVNTTNARLRIQNNIPDSITLTEVWFNGYRSTFNTTLEAGRITNILVNHTHSITEKGTQIQADVQFVYTIYNKSITLHGQAPVIETVTDGYI